MEEGFKENEQFRPRFHFKKIELAHDCRRIKVLFKQPASNKNKIRVEQQHHSFYN